MSLQKHSVYPQVANDPTAEPMFLGQPVNLSRYDIQSHPMFEKLIEKQLSFFWRPEEVDLSQDKIDFNSMPEHEQHIFVSNLKYQILMDSIQGRSPNLALLPITSLPELETWIETWAFSETIHSRSYTHIIRNIFTNPSEVFDGIIENKEIAKRATSIGKYYDDLIEIINDYNFFKAKYKDGGANFDTLVRELKKRLYKCIMAVNILEAVRFYVSFACSFAFAERELMEGNAKIIRLIGRDEALHLVGTQYILNVWRSGRDDPEMKAIAEECKEESIRMFKDTAQEEKQWAEYLFKDGSMIGLNKDILCKYVEYITNSRMVDVGLEMAFPETTSNPIPWINSWLSSDSVQVAPQEVEVSSYLVGQIDASLDTAELSDFEL